MPFKYVSLGAMIAQLHGLCGTADVSAWEDQFITDIAARSDNGQCTWMITEKQIDVIERLYRKHYA